MGIDYGFLFQQSDLFRRKNDLINYDYYEEHPEEKETLGEAEELFARTLVRISPRLKILGHTIDTARAEYQAVVEEAIGYADDRAPEELENYYLTFEDFCNLACSYPLNDLMDDYFDYNTPDRDTLCQGRFVNHIEEISRIPQNENSDFYWSETSFFSSKFCILSAESMLQIFALNPANFEIEVTWEFGPIVHAGWVARDEFRPGARKMQKILIATEGSSDAHIIRRSLDVLSPDVADFFNFVDGDDRHHFWGSSNLVKFAEGLFRIDVINQVLFVFDNDAEGVDAFRKLEKLKLPANMRAMLLPNLDEFRRFLTRGPEGTSESDINGRAAAIECYLDLRLEQYQAPVVIWSNYKKDIDTWHGALEFKESYSKHFYEQSDEQLRSGSYDVSKLLRLTDALLQQSVLVIPAV
jgi:hypothetical protein